jgi:hypothetical protein
MSKPFKPEIVKVLNREHDPETFAVYQRVNREVTALVIKYMPEGEEVVMQKVDEYIKEHPLEQAILNNFIAMSTGALVVSNKNNL